MFFSLGFNVWSQNNIESNKVENAQKIKALEVESFVLMYFQEGYHVALGYRFGDFRIRASVAAMKGTDVEVNMFSSKESDFERYFDDISAGVFFDYFLWKDLHVYTFIDTQNWLIVNKENGQEKNMRSIDTGLGIGYQFFIGKKERLYVQPSFHTYVRSKKETTVGGSKYSIPQMDPVLSFRIGYRLKTFK